MGDQPYQFGDVVDGHRWTITGWEPIEPSERTVGVPRLLEARYAAMQESRRRTQTLEREASLMVTDSPPEREARSEHPTATGVDTPGENLGGGRLIVAAPDLAIEYDDEPLRFVEPQPIDEPIGEFVPPDESSIERRPSVEPSRTTALSGIDGTQLDDSAPAARPVDDAPFAAALALGAKALAESYQPSDIEIAAGAATASHPPIQTWNASATEPIDEWNAAGPGSMVPEPLDVHEHAHGTVVLAPPGPEAEHESGRRAISSTQPPPAGWYPGSP